MHRTDRVARLFATLLLFTVTAVLAQPLASNVVATYLELERSSSAYIHVDFLFAFTISLRVDDLDRKTDAQVKNTNCKI